MNIAKRVKRILRRQTTAREFLSDHRVLVGTHHKTGTVWLQSIFTEIAEQTGLSLYSGDVGNLQDGHDIFFQDHSHFGDEILKGDAYRGVHIIRDPRDIMISGMFYHQKSSEPQLHRPREEFGGASYQQKLNSIESLYEQLDFEMRNAALHTTRDMAAWDYRNPRFMEVKYEDLIADEDLTRFREIFAFLGFRDRAIPMCLEIAYDKSLFSGKVKKSLHVRSGESNQWQEHLTEAHRRSFLELHGDLLVRLGYEEDDSWVKPATASHRNRDS